MVAKTIAKNLLFIHKPTDYNHNGLFGHVPLPHATEFEWAVA